MLIYLNLLTFFNKYNSSKICIFQNICLPLSRQIKNQLRIMVIYMDDCIASDIVMLDDDTCVMYYEAYTDGDVICGFFVEYWL